MTKNIFNEFEQNRDYTIERLDRIASAVSLFTVSDEIRFLYFNRSCDQLLGYEHGKMLALTNENPLQLFHPDHEDMLISSIISSMRQGRLFTYDCRMLCADGGYKWIRLSAELIQSPGGILCYYCVLSEIEPPQDTLMKGIHALIVAPQEKDRLTLSKLIEGMGGSCDLFENGLDAIDSFTDSDDNFYQCVFATTKICNINGFELVKELRHCGHPQSADIDVVLIIDPEDENDVPDTDDIGISSYLIRPFDTDSINKALK